jgi:hypothetical protein
MPAGTSGEIVSFEQLPEVMTAQTVTLSTPLEDLKLPYDSLTLSTKVDGY